MRIALETLGYLETNHGFTVWTNLSEMEMWTEERQAVTDFPHLIFAPELIAAYPDAKVVLTTRSPDSWWKSYQSTIASSLARPREDTRLLATRLPRDVQDYGHYPGGCEEALCGDEIRALVPKERLLEYQVGEAGGWDRLCAFLGKEVPVGVLCPKVNDTQAFHDHMKSRVMPIWKRAAKKYLVPAVFMCAFMFMLGST
ncbi:hypothetical protein C8F01DRAFT_1370594 [Mycena amicta]|nr:hypothetical protein C8F01DRAFT_1370594 [Mycena amicta]